MSAPNVHEPRFDAGSEREGSSFRRARLGRQAGARRLGASLYELPAGQTSFPYHWHSANEELLIVLRGRPWLRTPDGWRELAEGEVVSFGTGPEGAHQLLNRGPEPVRVLVVSEMNAPEVSGYPDSGKLGAFTRAPGSPEDEDSIFGFFATDAAVGYWDAEPEPDPG